MPALERTRRANERRSWCSPASSGSSATTSSSSGSTRPLSRERSATSWGSRTTTTSSSSSTSSAPSRVAAAARASPRTRRSRPARDEWRKLRGAIGDEFVKEVFAVIFRLNANYVKASYTTDTYIKIGEVAYLLTAAAGWNPRGLEMSSRAPRRPSRSSPTACSRRTSGARSASASWPARSEPDLGQPGPRARPRDRAALHGDGPRLRDLRRARGGGARGHAPRERRRRRTRDRATTSRSPPKTRDATTSRGAARRRHPLGLRRREHRDRPRDARAARGLEDEQPEDEQREDETTARLDRPHGDGSQEQGARRSEERALRRRQRGEARGSRQGTGRQEGAAPG